MSAENQDLLCWAVSFGGIVMPFESRADCKRYIKDQQKKIADRRGSFKATIVRTALKPEAIQ